MCGGLVVNVARDSKSVVLYNLGRLLSYSSLGALAGAFGSTVFDSGFSKNVPWIASLTMGSFLVYAGINRMTGKTFHITLPQFFSKFSTRVLSFAVAKSKHQAGVFTLGALSALLPCGWLYTFVIAATATKSAKMGALSLTLFWLGTLPALAATPLLFSQMTNRVQKIYPKISGAIFVCLGLFALGTHTLSYPIQKNPHSKQEPMQSCPLHHH